MKSWLLLAGLAAAAADLPIGRAQPAGPAALPLVDADLNDVCFVDPDRGWAVGDRGAVWATEDGGRNWKLQPAPVACRLESISFVDDRCGWIVGGSTHPYTHRSSGVVLRTVDGGRRWELIPRLSVPALRRVKFFDRRNGWAVGHDSPLYPAGLLQTTDGGLSWSSLQTDEPGGWQTGDFVPGGGGACAGADGLAAKSDARRVRLASLPDCGRRDLRCLRLSPGESPRGWSGSGPAGGWLVGDGGLVLQTADGGGSWKPPAAPWPAACEDFDWRCVAVLGEACWIAGYPGTRIWHTADGGRTWQAFDSGQTLPIQALTFLDRQRGWAVGALGTILATRDGGRSWMAQQGGGRRAAVLGIFSRWERLPLELVAQLSANDGYLSVLEIIACEEQPPAAHQVPLDSRLHEAVVAAGGSHAERHRLFELPPAGRWLAPSAILAHWDGREPGAGSSRLQRRLVRAIRTWRPTIIISDAAGSAGDDGLAQILKSAVCEAVEQAEDAEAQPELARSTGLVPWQVKKIFQALPPERSGTINLTTAQLASRLGCSVSDQARPGWQLLRDRHQPPPQSCGFQLLSDRLAGEVGRQDFFSGLTLAPGGDARRPLQSAPPGDIHSLNRLVQQRRNIQRLLEYASGSASSGSAWPGQIESLTGDLEPAAAGDVLFELAQTLGQAGRLDLASDVYASLLRRCPQHPSGEAALLWLVQYYASSEARWAFDRPRAAVPGLAAGTASEEPAPPAANDAVQPASFTADGPLSVAGLALTPTLPPIVVAPEPADRAARALGFAELVQHRAATLFVDPRLRFPLTAAERVAGRELNAETYLRSVVGSRGRDAWWECAKVELWLRQPERLPPKPLAVCPECPQRPYLDGRLDDPAWSECLPLSLVSRRPNDADRPAAVLLARDDEFLYVGISCRKGPGVAYPPSARPRPRDPDLSARDRVEILIDVDRDYATYYRLVVDHRGWAAEDCCGSPAWNPQWFIAVAETASGWTAECAIPWRELVESPPRPAAVWAVGFQRITPGAGFQSWTQPADLQARPEGFGLLRFE